MIESLQSIYLSLRRTDVLNIDTIDFKINSSMFMDISRFLIAVKDGCYLKLVLEGLSGADTED